MDSQESRHLPTALANRAASGTDSAAVGRSLVSIWTDFDSTLAPILGQRGVAALYRRSIHVAGARHPWLIDVHEPPQTAVDFAALGRAVDLQARAEAGAGAIALIHAFCELLASLVGPSLMERMLGPVLASASSGPPAQDSRDE